MKIKYDNGIAMNLYEVKDQLIAHLGESGFTDSARAYSILRELLDRAPDRPDLVEKVLERCAASASPDQCFLNFRASSTNHSRPIAVRDLVETTRGRRRFALFASSNYLRLSISQPSLPTCCIRGGGILRERISQIAHEVSPYRTPSRKRSGFLEESIISRSGTISISPSANC
jgi:hypothetical protein